MVAGLLGGALAAIGAERANRKSIELSNTAYQRAMADMRKGGLNPILAGKYGGASTPQMQNVGAAGAQGYAQSLQASSSASLQKAQTTQTQVLTQGANLDNLIKTVKNVPQAQVEGALYRIGSVFTGYLDQMSEKYIPRTMPQELEMQMLELFDTAFQTGRGAFQTLLGALKRADKPAQELVVEVFTDQGKLVEKGFNTAKGLQYAPISKSGAVGKLAKPILNAIFGISDSENAEIDKAFRSKK
jgi:hypothetical protein